MEKLLQRMISPNADLRCTAMQAIADSYWQESRRESMITTAHSQLIGELLFEKELADMTLSLERATSYDSSMVFEKDVDVDDSIVMTPEWKKKENFMQSPPGLDVSDVFTDDTKRPTLSKAKSQPKVAASKCMYGQIRRTFIGTDMKYP